MKTNIFKIRRFAVGILLTLSFSFLFLVNGCATDEQLTPNLPATMVDAIFDNPYRVY